MMNYRPFFIHLVNFTLAKGGLFHYVERKENSKLTNFIYITSNDKYQSFSFLFFFFNVMIFVNL